jgi:lipopolysaccharide transport system permease protein
MKITDNKLSENKPIKRVYTPESLLIHPLALLNDMKSDFKAALQLSIRLTIRDLSAQYRQTVLGYFWAILPPLLTSIVFIILQKSSIVNLDSSSIPYPVFVFTGTIFWQLFTDSLNAPIKFVNLNRSMITKINFPKEAIIFSGLFQVLFSFLIKMLLLVLVVFVYSTQIQENVFLSIIPIIGILLFGTLCGILMVPIGILYQDIQQAVALLLPGIMLLTPVVYMPLKTGFLFQINQYNPLTPLIMTARDSLFFEIQPYFFSCAKITIISFLALLFSFVIYRVALPHLIERMEA